MDDKNKMCTFGYRLGQVFATVCSACVMALVIALTAKLVSWIF